MNVVDFLARRTAGLECRSNHDEQLYRLKSRQNEEYKVTNGEDHLTACSGCTTSGHENLIVLGIPYGRVFLHDTDKINSDTPICQLKTQTNGFNDIAWMPGELKLMIVSSSCNSKLTAELWDISRSDPMQVGRFMLDNNTHRRNVSKAVFHPRNKAVLVTGDTDGRIDIWDIRSIGESMGPVMKIYNVHGSSVNRSNATRKHPISDLVFRDDFSLFTCSSCDGVIKVWDMRMHESVGFAETHPKWMLKFPNNESGGFTNMLLSRDRSCLYTTATDGNIYEYNLVAYDYDPVAKFTGGSPAFAKSCLSPDGQYILSASTNRGAYIWKIRNPGCPIINLRYHSEFNEYYHFVGWSNSRGTKLFAYTQDGSYRPWRIFPANETQSDFDDIMGWAEIVESSTQEQILEFIDQ